MAVRKHFLGTRYQRTKLIGTDTGRISFQRMAMVAWAADEAQFRSEKRLAEKATLDSWAKTDTLFLTRDAVLHEILKASDSSLDNDNWWWRGKPIADILFKYKHISADPNKVDHHFHFNHLSTDVFYYPRLTCKQKRTT